MSFKGGNFLRIDQEYQVKPKHSLLRKMWNFRYEYLILFPVLVFFIVFCYAPMYGVIIAFKDYKMSLGILASPWLDPLFQNFERAFTSDIFLRALNNTLILSFLKLVVAFPIPILFAILLDELPGRRFPKMIQTVSYLPYFISWVVLGGIVRTLLSPSYGAVNVIVKAFTGSTIYFLGESDLFRGVAFFTYLWQTMGYSAVIYLAAIASIDQEQYEAARIDGASRFQLVRYITLPSISSVIVVMLILGLRSVMTAGFDQVFNLYSPTTYPTADIIDTYVYRVGIVDKQYSYSTAVGLFQNVIGLILVLVTNSIARRANPDKALF